MGTLMSDCQEPRRSRMILFLSCAGGHRVAGLIGNSEAKCLQMHRRCSFRVLQRRPPAQRCCLEHQQESVRCRFIAVPRGTVASELSDQGNSFLEATSQGSNSRCKDRQLNCSQSASFHGLCLLSGVCVGAKGWDDPLEQECLCDHHRCMSCTQRRAKDEQDEDAMTTCSD
eukprot:Amastigsp_a339872_160.p1 type:complete len:171 gc:universal Amastigsp_a339872_160:1153-641(-)